MPNVRIVTDSTADVPLELVDSLGIAIVPLMVNFGEESYRDGIDLSTDAFYERLKTTKSMPTTSQPSVGAFEEMYDSLVSGADGIVSIHLSAALSGTCSSALQARETFAGRCPIEVIDSRQASLGIGIIAMSCARLARDGASVEEISEHARRMIPGIHTLFLVETLEYLQRGGRIGRAAAFLGTLLSVRPLLGVEEGEIRPVEKVRTRNRGIDKLAEFAASFPNVEEIAVMHATTPADADELSRRAKALVSPRRAVVGQVGAVIGTHTGPGVIGMVVCQGLGK